MGEELPHAAGFQLEHPVRISRGNHLIHHWVVKRHPLQIGDWLAAIADIHAAIVDLRRYTPVVGIITGTVGCFGGMSIAAALCSYLIVTREARLGLNGPQVIEQEAGIEEYDSRNRPFIWSMTGGEIRAASGLVDALVNDGVNAVKTAMNEAIAKGVPVQHRSDNYDDYLRRLSQFDTRQQADTAQIKQLFAREDK